MTRTVVDESVSLADAKAHLRVTFADEDALIERWISAARQHLENFTRNIHAKSTFVDTFESFVSDLSGNLLSVESVEYYDANNEPQTLAPSVYFVDTKSQPGRLKLNPRESWPFVYDRHEAITINYTAGIANEDIQTAILLLVGNFYENREDATSLTIKQIPHGAESLAHPYRLYLS